MNNVQYQLTRFETPTAKKFNGVAVICPRKGCQAIVIPDSRHAVTTCPVCGFLFSNKQER